MKKTGLTHLGIEYKVNEKKGVVTAILKTTLRNYVDSYYITGNCKGKEISKRRENTFYGIAKCSPKDTFSLEIGKRIAESRAKRAAFCWLTNSYSEFLKYIERMRDEVATLKENSSYCAFREKEHIEFLLDSIPETKKV